MSEIYAHHDACNGTHADDGTCGTRRCARCHNHVAVCGHNLPFAERMKSIGIDRTSLTVK